MDTHQEPLNALNDIRTMMQRSSRFISLSGLAGVFSGIFALIGAALAWWITHQDAWIVRAEDTEFGSGTIVDVQWSVVWQLLALAILVFGASISVSYYFTRQKAIRTHQPLWGPYSRLMLINLIIPLLTGGLFCVILFLHGLIGLIAPATLIFYGLALLNAGKYSFEEISLLGISEIVLGLISMMLTGQGLLFWALGFGVLHIVYGIIMFYRHD